MDFGLETNATDSEKLDASWVRLQRYITLICPIDELWRRLEGRNAIGAQDTVPITKELLQECWRRFQRPDEAELALFTRAVVYRR
jgi:hypothetical protein